MTITILGRQPAIGLAELESLYGSENVRAVGDTAALIDADIDFARLGSSVKAAEYLATVESTNAQKVFDYARRALPEFVAELPEGKIKLGTSLYGLDMPVQKQNANTLSLKKVLRDIGRSVRVVPNTESALSSAQTYHNQLTSAVGCELLFVRDGNSTLVGRVTDVQNINEYAERDRDRPKRDTRVGMLPPKLAQTIINLAVGEWETKNKDTKDLIVLDPFCGTGVVLMEASLMGYKAYGTDIEPRMISYSQANLDWLASRPLPTTAPFALEVGDATSYTWKLPTSARVACEGYLGTPFANEPPEAALRDTIGTCNLITTKFLRNIRDQVAGGTRLCIAAPSWFVRGRIYHLPLLDDIATTGYKRVEFTHAANSDLLYHRDDQIVGRELLVLEAV